MSKISVEFTKQDGLYKSVLSFSEEELSEARKATAKQIGPSKQIQGFRKGKVPEHLLFAKFAKEIEDKTVNTLVSMNLPEIRKKLESDIHKIYSIQQKKDFSIELIFDCMPYMKLCKLKEATLYDDDFFASEDDIHTELFKLQLFWAQEKNNKTKKEGVDYQKNDLLILDTEFISDATPEGHVENDVEFLIGMPTSHEKLKTYILKNKPSKNEEFQITDEIHNKKQTIVVKIKEAYTLNLPQLDDKFASEIQPDCKNIEEFKKRISKALVNQAEHDFYIGQLKYAFQVYHEKSQTFTPKGYLESNFEQYLENLKLDQRNMSPQLMENYKKIFEQQMHNQIVFTTLLDKVREAQQDFKEEEKKESMMNYLRKNQQKYKKLLEALDSGGQKEILHQEDDPLLQEFNLEYAQFSIYEFLKQNGVLKKGTRRSVSDPRKIGS